MWLLLAPILLAAGSIAPAILEAVAAMPALREPGGGIVYSVNIEEFIPLGG